MIKTILKKEIKETLFSMKGVIWFFVVTILFSAMNFAAVSVKELSLMAQTEQMVAFMKLVFEIGSFIAVILAAVSFSHEREEETLEALLLTPSSNIQLLMGKLSASLFMSFWIFAFGVPYLFGLGYRSNETTVSILLLFLLGMLLSAAYSMIAEGLSILLGNSRSAVITSVVVVVITGLPILMSTAMKKAGFAYYLNRISPLSNLFNIWKEVIINHRNVGFVSLNLIMMVLFFLVSLCFLSYCSKKLTFQGGE
jgi:ABC-2 type transport system permease protein